MSFNRTSKNAEQTLHELFSPLNYRQRLEQLYTHFAPEKVLFTSSFGTNSAFLLWLISQIQPQQKLFLRYALPFSRNNCLQKTPDRIVQFTGH